MAVSPPVVVLYLDPLRFRDGDGGEELSYVWKPIGLSVSYLQLGANSLFPSSGGGTAGKSWPEAAKPTSTFPSHGIILKLPSITKRGCIKRSGSTQLHSRYCFSGSSSPKPRDFGAFLCSLLVRGYFFSPYCQHCWVETMAHITETQRSVLGELRPTYDADWLRGAMSEAVIGRRRLSVRAGGKTRL